MRKTLFLFVFCIIVNTGFAQLRDNIIHVSLRKGMVIPDRDGYKVLSYELAVIQKEQGDMRGPYYVEAGRALTEEVKRCMAHMQQGDKIILENIKLQELGSNKIVQAADYSEILK